MFICHGCLLKSFSPTIAFSSFLSLPHIRETQEQLAYFTDTVSLHTYEELPALFPLVKLITSQIWHI